MDPLKTPVPNNFKNSKPTTKYITTNLDDLKTPTPYSVNSYQSQPLYQSTINRPRITNTREMCNSKLNYTGIEKGYCVNKILMRRRLAPIPQIKIQ